MQYYFHMGSMKETDTYVDSAISPENRPMEEKQKETMNVKHADLGPITISQALFLLL